MNAWDLLQWWNLIFVLPFAAGLIYLFFMCSGLVSSENAGDGDVAGDGDHSIEHDVGSDHDVGHDAGHEGEHDTGDSSFLRALSFLGLGKAPVSVLLMCFCFIWGFTGWAANLILSKILFLPVLFVWPSLVTAFLLSVLFTRWLAQLFCRFMPSTETYGMTNRQLIGKSAEAIFNITEKFGMARTMDDSGNIQDVYCRVRAGKEPIPKQSKVVLMEYDEAEKFFYVTQNPLG
jgi:hypothetical protein